MGPKPVLVCKHQTRPAPKKQFSKIKESDVFCYRLPHHGATAHLRARACQPTACLTCICPQMEVNDQPGILGVTYDQHVECASQCWLSRPDYNFQDKFVPI